MPTAVALEMVHTMSLIHDDLPAMDNDDLRRGRPTCHKVYGEGMAVLTGDALLTEAFLILAQTSPTKRYPTASYVAELALTGGSTKLIGGQVMDLEGEGKKLTKAQLVKIHESKTAALLATSIRLGATTANATDRQLETVAPPTWRNGASVTVVMASDGYPGTVIKGRPIRGLEAAAAIEKSVAFVTSQKLESMAAGKMGYSTSEVGDLVVENL